MTFGSYTRKKLISKLELAENEIAALQSKIESNFRTDRNIREIEEKYKFIVNAYGELMSLINTKYEYELVNDSLCIAFGKSREDFIGKTVAEVWGKEKFNAEIKRKIDQCFKGMIFKEEDTFKIPGGGIRYYAVTYYPYRNEHNEITHIVGVTDDITERKKVEQALKESEEELRIMNDKKDKYLAIINSDLEQASNHIRSLLPDPQVGPDLEISWKVVPSIKLGGDSLGYHWIDDDHFAIYILDVSGHGIDAALHSVSALNAIKFENLVNTDFRKPEEVLKGLNNVFQMQDHNAKFITMWYLVYIPSTSELRCAGAGHPPLMIFPPRSDAIKIESRNIMVGAEQKYDFRIDKVKLDKNSRLYLYTDGAYEIQLSEGKMMDVEDLVEYIGKSNENGDDELDKHYENLVKLNNNENLSDDFTMLKVTF